MSSINRGRLQRIYLDIKVGIKLEDTLHSWLCKMSRNFMGSSSFASGNGGSHHPYDWPPDWWAVKFDGNSTLNLLREIIALLPDEQQQVIYHYYIADADISDIPDFDTHYWKAMKAIHKAYMLAYLKEIGGTEDAGRSTTGKAHGRHRFSRRNSNKLGGVDVGNVGSVPEGQQG